MYAYVQTLREKEHTKRVGTLWSKEEEAQLLRELSEKLGIEEISRIHQRTENGIRARRNTLIRKDVENHSSSDEEICNKYNISELEYHMILSKNTKEVKRSHEDSQEERIVRLENEVKEIHKTLCEIRDYLKLLTISSNVNENQNIFENTKNTKNTNSNNPFD